jgi:hypothetical protein
MPSSGKLRRVALVGTVVLGEPSAVDTEQTMMTQRSTSQFAGILYLKNKT